MGDKVIANLKLVRNSFHGEWNYTLLPWYPKWSDYYLTSPELQNRALHIVRAT
ncbi:MAG: hypothetical protein OXE94_03265 [Aestuariivita sp.]|nr:hypothetical protein [Aestuariivita sp.]MCY4201916.1 hypothetical protein [Aestuariivita sp.]MCY4288242.1 hypothetical protein [Aestuariivita sp.]MCY4348128.1 hypothetical protein [Aestuariivita sp.]